MKTHVDTDQRVIRDELGRSFAYDLQRKRVWNIARRKHIGELTGKIEVAFPSIGQAGCWAVRTFATFDAACAEANRFPSDFYRAPTEYAHRVLGIALRSIA